MKNSDKKFRITLTILLFSLSLLPTVGTCDEKVVRVGMTSALSGPSSDLGKSMERGIKAYFKHINETGGVNGNILELISLDDSYQPTSAAANMRQLIHKEKVIAVMGNVGTPTAMVTIPIAIDNKILLFGAYTGANVLRKKPAERYVINFRASYEQETSQMIDMIIASGVKAEEIAFFTQNDGYGDSGYDGAIKALEDAGHKRDMTGGHGRYKRSTLQVEDGLLTIYNKLPKPKAIIVVATYSASAKFIKMAKIIFPGATFYNVSFVGSNALANALGNEGERVIITQVVPHFTSELPGVAEYRELLKQYDVDASPGFVSLEGFLVAKTFVEGLKLVKGRVNRENIIDAIEKIKRLDIGIDRDVLITYGKDNHQALNRVWATEIKCNEVIEFAMSEKSNQIYTTEKGKDDKCQKINNQDAM